MNPATNDPSQHRYTYPETFLQSDPFAAISHPIGSDEVNSPGHYTWLPVEAIEITERFNFCMGNALKYIIRADFKGRAVEDLRKARWYIDREIQRREE